MREQSRHPRNSIRRHLTYANVMSTLFVFLVVAGGTAIAAKGLGKNSVGPKQLKANAVTSAKIKKGAVTKAKLAKGAVTAEALADGSVSGAKLADGSVTGADFAPSSTPFSQVVARIQNPADVAFTPGAIFTIGTYTQQPDEDNQYLVSIDITFPAGCEPTRTAFALLTINAADPSMPTIYDLSGGATVVDQSAGTTTKRVNFGAAPGGFGSLNRAPPLAPAARTFSVLLQEATCSKGSGVTVTNSIVEVIGTK